MTWRQDSAAIIHEATKGLSKDLPLAERIKIVDAARPSWYHGASWPKKAWQAARRDYLVPFGYEPKTKRSAQRRQSVVGELPLFRGDQNHD